MPRLAPLVALTLACGPTPVADEPATTTVITSTTTATTVIPTTTDLSTSTTAPLVDDLPREPDLFESLACNTFTQDCPPGQKCAPYAEGGGTAWNATKCVDVTGEGAPGDPCTAPEGGAAGPDDCALGSFCWDVGEDNHGTCVLHCMGSDGVPVCPPGYQCGFGGGALAICLPWCDPLVQDCPNSICVPNGEGFSCAADDSGEAGQTNDPCEFINSCDPGLACLDPEAASSACDPQTTGCCQPFCMLPDGPCPNADQQCIPWFDPRDAIPPGYEHVGFCGIP